MQVRVQRHKLAMRHRSAALDFHTHDMFGVVCTKQESADVAGGLSAPPASDVLDGAFQGNPFDEIHNPAAGPDPSESQQLPADFPQPVPGETVQFAESAECPEGEGQGEVAVSVFSAADAEAAAQQPDDTAAGSPTKEDVEEQVDTADTTNLEAVHEVQAEAVGAEPEKADPAGISADSSPEVSAESAGCIVHELSTYLGKSFPSSACF